MSQTVNMTAVQALETIAVACAITAARLGNAEGLAFWQGQFNAAQSLKNGTAAACAKRIALSGYPVQREVEGAFACLSNDPKGLTSARVHEVLMAYCIDAPGHNLSAPTTRRQPQPPAARPEPCERCTPKKCPSHPGCVGFLNSRRTSQPPLDPAQSYSVGLTQAGMLVVVEGGAA